MSTTFPAPGLPITAEIEVKKSRFICTIGRVDSEEDAREFIATVRSSMPTARHHVPAFIISVPSAQDIERSSDDGEPSGTAGRPVLDVLRGSGLTNVVAVVTRYFGGVLLGTGGLVRAYSDAVSAALPLVARVRQVSRQRLNVSAPHADASKLEAELRNRGVDVVGARYSATETTLELEVDDADEVTDLIAALSAGQAQVIDAGVVTSEVPTR